MNYLTPQYLDRLILGLVQRVAPGLPKVLPTYGDLIGFPLWCIFIFVLMVCWKKYHGYQIRW